MRILIEDHTYNCSIEKFLGYKPKDNQINTVGYFFNKEINDCVFLLPKVIMDKDDKVFGKYLPEDIIYFTQVEQEDKILSEEEKFLYSFSLWIYRAINTFKNNNPETSIVRQNSVAKSDNSINETNSTLIDIIISILKFNKENKNFLTFATQNINNAQNKINWSKTIACKQPVIHKSRLIYVDTANKAKQANYEEELFVIYFTIIRYINRKYGFKTALNSNFELISDNEFEKYLNGYGALRLRQIKYKYFSDKALKMWNLCFAFLQKTSSIKSSSQTNDFLLASDFNIVFEGIINELISGKDIPSDLKKQKDGKIVDHIFKYKSLINNKSYIFYIGDSKYYKIGHEVKGESEYKQYTYVKNVLQYMIDQSFKKETKGMLYRDEITEGYNITPNFFISSEINKDFDYSYGKLIHRKEQDRHQFHFKNRLFDRDTLWLSHYDINFLFVISQYATANEINKRQFKKEIYENIYQETLSVLNNNYVFYKLNCKENVALRNSIDKHFRRINGKVIAINSKTIILATERGSENSEEINNLLNDLSTDFEIERDISLTNI